MSESRAPQIDWMLDPEHTGRKVVVVSLESRIAQLRERAQGCRDAYRQDYMRVPMEYLGQAFDDAATVLQSRLDALERPARGAADAATKSASESTGTIAPQIPTLAEIARQAAIETWRKHNGIAPDGRDILDVLADAVATAVLQAAIADIKRRDPLYYSELDMDDVVGWLSALLASIEDQPKESR